MSSEFKPKCIWCKASWSDENVRLEYSAGHCDTCSIGEGSRVQIICHKCKKLMYEKETYGFSG